MNQLIDPRPLLRLFVYACAVVMVLLVAACSQQTDSDEEAPLEPEDLPESVVIDPENDPRAAPRRESLGGALPGGFPSDLPVPLPASVIDFGEGSDGMAFVVLSTSVSSAQLRPDLANKLRHRGWQGLTGPLGDTPQTLRKDGRVVRVHVERASTGSTYRYDYRP